MRRALLVSAWLICSSAHAEVSPLLGGPNPLRALLPSAAAERADRSAKLERSIERSLNALDGVASSHVTLQLPAVEAAALDAPLLPPRMHVLLKLTARGPTDQVVLALVRAQLPEPIEPITIQRSASSSQSQRTAASVKVGPFTVEAQSAPGLRLLLALCLCANALMAVLLLTRKSVGRRR